MKSSQVWINRCLVATARAACYPFHFRGPVAAKWVRARYVAKRHEIAARPTERQITGPPEIRAGTDAAFSMLKWLSRMTANGCGFNWSAQHMLGLGDATASACQSGTKRK